MNLTRIAILGVAAVSAGAAALLVRGLLGGGTPSVEASLPPPTPTEQILVAARNITPGVALDAGSVRWEEWPDKSINDSFIRESTAPDIEMAVAGIVVRQPLVDGEPILESKIVRAGAAGFLAATIQPGNRAISIPVTAETGAGGFILPNDRVDVILTRDVSKGEDKSYLTQTILRDVRVLAIDQAAKPEDDQDSVVGKTATLELNQSDAQRIALAIVEARRENGSLTLSLRALGDSGGEEEYVRPIGGGTSPSVSSKIVVFRYGMVRKTADELNTGGGAQ